MITTQQPLFNNDNKLSILLVALVLLILLFITTSCTDNTNKVYPTLIKEEEFINDINSFGNYATYEYISNTDSSYVFITKQNDSIFTYNVEKTGTIQGIYRTKYQGQYVK